MYRLELDIDESGRFAPEAEDANIDFLIRYGRQTHFPYQVKDDSGHIVAHGPIDNTPDPCAYEIVKAKRKAAYAIAIREKTDEAWFRYRFWRKEENRLSGKRWRTASGRRI